MFSLFIGGFYTHKIKVLTRGDLTGLFTSIFRHLYINRTKYGYLRYLLCGVRQSVVVIGHTLRIIPRPFSTLIQGPRWCTQHIYLSTRVGSPQEPSFVQD